MWYGHGSTGCIGTYMYALRHVGPASLQHLFGCETLSLMYCLCYVILVQVASTSSKKKSSSKSGKKRHHPKSMSAEDPHDSNCNTSDRKSKKKSIAQQSSGASKTGKSKRRRTKNKLDVNKQVSQHENRDLDMEISTTDQVPSAGMISSTNNAKENLEVTAIQLALEDGEDNTPLQRMSRAEERKREIERKRAEKRELERLKREEEERKAKLQVRLWLHVH